MLGPRSMLLSGTTEETTATAAVKAHVQAGATGALCLGAGLAESRLYLLDGAIVAARSAADAPALIQRLVRGEHIADSRATQLSTMAQAADPKAAHQGHDPIIGLLVDEVDRRILDLMLTQRFEENVARFLGSRTKPRFIEGVAPWTDNIQLGQDPRALMRRCLALWVRSHGLDTHLPLTVGSTAPDAPIEELAVGLLARADKSAGELAQSLPLDEIAARASVSIMLARGVLIARGAAGAEDDGAGWDETFEVGARPQADQEMPRDNTLLSSDDLDAFSGQGDDYRGSAKEGGGGFSTKHHNLDRVELPSLGEDTEEAALEPAPTTGRSARFAAPELSDEEAGGKIHVANEVLQIVSQALDEALGKAAGAGVLQLLVDGRPRQFLPLLEEIQVTSAGGLPSRALLANLKRRPATEQRHLLNKGLLDLLDRALDRSAEELPDEAFDAVLEQVVGYRQRLGL